MTTCLLNLLGAVERLEADYVHRCCSTGRRGLRRPVRRSICYFTETGRAAAGEFNITVVTFYTAALKPIDVIRLGPVCSQPALYTL